MLQAQTFINISFISTFLFSQALENYAPLYMIAYRTSLFIQLENLMYYTENNHNKVVLRDFYLSTFENGPITEPCGTPEYLGKMPLLYQCFCVFVCALIH